MGNQNSTENGNQNGGGWVGDNFLEGYHILKVQDDSPGERAGLVAFFDFIVAADGTPVSSEQQQQQGTGNNNTTLVEKLKLAAEQKKSVRLQLYNSKEDQVRETFIEPSHSWGGKGLIGVSIRLCSLRAANEFVWHVLEVYENSPASKAGLVAYEDYIVGTPSLLFSSSEDFYTLIRSNQGTACDLYVYNLNADDIRVVTIQPDPNWGGDGSLGCNVGFGLLHRVPTKANIAAARALGSELDVLRPEMVATTKTVPQQRQQAPAAAQNRTPQRAAAPPKSSTPLSPEQVVIQDRLEAARLARLRAEQEERELASQLEQLAVAQQQQDDVVNTPTEDGDNNDDNDIVDLQEIDLQQAEPERELHHQPQSLAELRQIMALDDVDDEEQVHDNDNEKKDNEEEKDDEVISKPQQSLSPPRTQPPIATPPASPANIGDTASPLVTSTAGGATSLEQLAQRRRDLAARLAKLKVEE